METKDIKDTKDAKSLKMKESMARINQIAKTILVQSEAFVLAASQQLEAAGDVLLRVGISAIPGLVSVCVLQAAYTMIMSLIGLVTGSGGLFGLMLANLPVVLFAGAALIKKYKK